MDTLNLEKIFIALLPKLLESKGLYDIIKRELQNQGYSVKLGLSGASLVKMADSQFKLENWIVSPSGLLFKVCAIATSDRCYVVTSQGGGMCTLSFEDAQNYHLWTIQDAEKGDFLVAGSAMPFILKQINEDNTVSVHCCVDCIGQLAINQNRWVASSVCSPANEKQKAVLLSKLKAHGYKWDAAHKEVIRTLDSLEEHSLEKCNLNHYEQQSTSSIIKQTSSEISKPTFQVFIEEAGKWLKENASKYITIEEGQLKMKQSLVTDLKKAMEK